MLAQTDGGGAAHDERVEAVEGTGRAEDDGAAFGCLRVDVAEMRKIRRVERIAMHGDCMAGSRGRKSSTEQDGQGYKGRRQASSRRQKEVHRRLPLSGA